MNQLQIFGRDGERLIERLRESLPNNLTRGLMMETIQIRWGYIHSTFGLGGTNHPIVRYPEVVMGKVEELSGEDLIQLRPSRNYYYQLMIVRPIKQVGLHL